MGRTRLLCVLVLRLSFSCLAWAEQDTPILESLRLAAPSAPQRPPDPGPPWVVQKIPPQLIQRRFGTVQVTAVEADLSSGEFGLAVGLPSRGRGSSLREMARDHRAIAGLNFSFFDPPTMTTIGPVVSEGRLVHGRKGFRGALLRWTKEGRLEILHLPDNNPEEANRLLQESRLALAAGPMLLQDGEDVVHPSIEGEGFTKTQRFLYAPERSAVGLTAEGKLILVHAQDHAGPLTFSHLAAILKRLGAREAMAVDGGSSSGLYWKGRIFGETRRIVDALLLIENKH